MKRSTLLAKLPRTGSTVLKAMSAGAFAAALLAGAAPSAAAQQIAVGVRFGGPVHGAPVPSGPSFPPAFAPRPVFSGRPAAPFGFDRRRWDEHPEFVRRAAWERAHFGRPYGGYR